jgi:hypothetical protein
MLHRPALPPPTDFTLGDKFRLAFGGLILFLGIAILWRTLPIAFSVQAILVSALFIGFGIYRLRLGYKRWTQWRAEKDR